MFKILGYKRGATSPHTIAHHVRSETDAEKAVARAQRSHDWHRIEMYSDERPEFLQAWRGCDRPAVEQGGLG